MSVFLGLISLILGLHFLKDNLFVSIVLTLLFVIFIIYRFKWKKVALFLAIFTCGAIFTHVPRTYNNPNQVYSGVVIMAKQNYFLLYSHGERFYVYEKQNQREIGDFLEVGGTPTDCEFTTYESQIDFKEYLSKKGVRRSIKVHTIKNSFQNPIRLTNFKSKILTSLNKNAAPLVDAMVFNTKDYDSEVVSIAESINLIFLLSTAGIYFSFFIRTLKKLIFLKCEERESHVLSLLIVFPYVVFSFPKVGVLRVYLTNLLNTPKKGPVLMPKLSFLSIISISHLLLLVVNPYWAFDSGFLLGLFVVSFTYFLRFILKPSKNYRTKLITPALVFLFIQPFAQFRSGSLHLLTFFEQLVLIPVNEIFIILSIVFLIGLPIKGVINFGGNLLYETLSLFEKVDLKIPFSDYGEIYVFIFYGLFIIGIYFAESKRYRHLIYTSISALSLLLIGLIPIQPIIRSGVYFINVGQGDSILIQDHFHAVMIDTGGNLGFDMAKKTLIPFMNKHQIYHLDALITSHDDFDHSGSKDSLIRNFKVKTYLSDRDDFPYSVGNIHLTNLNIYDAKEENDSSLVLFMELYGTKYLFTGDAPKEIEQQIIKDNPELKCDILKAGHHGSKTSSDELFIRQIQPKEAVISVGRSNRYGHPNNEVIETLSRYDVKIRRTDIEGTISYLSYFRY